MYKLNSVIMKIGFDCLFSILLINNLVIFVWRIIWDTQDLYLKDNVYLSSLISLAISYLLLFIVKYIQISEINSKFNKSIVKKQQQQKLKPLDACNENKTAENSPKQKKILKKFILKMLILVFSIANINHWRAVWYFTSECTNNSLNGVLSIGLISILSLWSMKRVCALMSVPFQINKDCYQIAYQIQPTSVHHNYYMSLKNKYSNKIAPSIWQIYLSFLMEYLADFFTIQAWRSLWLLMDMYVFKENAIWSGTSSLSIGTLIMLVVSFLNKKINKFLCNEHSFNQSKLINQNSNKKALIDTINDNKLALLNVNGLPAEVKPMTLVEIEPEIKSEPNISTSLSAYESSNETSSLKIFLNKLCLHSTFFLIFIGTVTTWRGIWMIQLELCYPTISETDLWSKNILNSIYFLFSILILWSLDLTCALLSRSSCEDSYFTTKKNYVLKQNHFKSHFGSKKSYCSHKLKPATKWKEFIEHKLLCCSSKNKETILASSIYICKTQTNLIMKTPYI